MIKIVRVEPTEAFRIAVQFSDGSEGEYDLEPLIARDTGMVRILRDPAFFRRVFLELGAVCWPNGFELSPSAIHIELRVQGQLRHERDVA